MIVRYVGQLIERITQAVKEYGVEPRSDIVVRVGDYGPELPVEHVKVQGTLTGSKVIIQAKAPQ